MEFGKVKIGCKFSFYKNSKPVYVKTSDMEAEFAPFMRAGEQITIKSGIKLEPTFPVVVIKNR